MKAWLADTLLRLAFWINPEQQTVYATLAEIARLEERISELVVERVSVKEEISKVKKNVENISLLVGFSRGIQTPGGRK